MTENSYRFFQNKDCKYFPCHEGTEELNCLFCYCPLYAMNPCPGSYTYLEHKGKKIKECTNCTFPHEPQNYDVIMGLLGE